MSAHQERPGHTPALTTRMSPDGSTRTDVWHAGTTVETTTSDPFAYLEDPENPETIQWLETQARTTDEFFNAIPQEAKNKVAASVNHAFNYEAITGSNRVGSFIYQKRRSTTDKQPIIYRYVDSDDIAGPGTPILNPHEINTEGTVSINWYYPNADGTHIAYVQSDSVAQTHTLKIRNTLTGADLEEAIPYAYYAFVSWLPDNSGFHYSFYPDNKSIPEDDPRRTQGAYFHKLGTAINTDVPTINTNASTAGSSYAFVDQAMQYTFEGIQSGYADRQFRIASYTTDYTAHKFVEVFNSDEKKLKYVGLNEGFLYAIVTQPDSDNTLVCLNLTNGLHDNLKDAWETVDLESNDVLESAQIIGGQLVVNYLHQAQSQISVVDMQTGKKTPLPIPPMSTASIDGTSQSPWALMTVESFMTPPQLYKVNVATGSVEPVGNVRTPYENHNYSTELVTYQSTDGTPVSMFMVQKKGVTGKEPRKVLMHAYGGFKRSMKPLYDPSLASLVDQGYILAVPHVRGGGEKGAPWHAAGKKQLRQNANDDLYAARTYLLQHGITTPKQIAFWGRSNGGLLAAVTLTQNPADWGAIISQAPLTDMLRYHMHGAAHTWKKEYGDPQKPQDFAFLRQSSPYHNLVTGMAYSPTLVMAGTKDDNVPPHHAFKFAARLQQAQASANPTLLYTDAGMHGPENPLHMLIEQAIIKQLFLEATLAS